MKKTIVPLLELKDVRETARYLRDCLINPTNADIATDFPGTVTRYSGDNNTVHQKLEEAKGLCKPGYREQFISFAQQRVAGMSIITLLHDVPEGIDPHWPNVSGFICNPWRRQGLGALSLATRLAVVDERFDGKAWTLVRQNNVASQNLVEQAGFQFMAEHTGGNDPQFLYGYGLYCMKRRIY